MADFTPEELERYRQWAESVRPSIENVDDLRELQGMAELAARAERGANAPISSLGEAAKGLENLKAKSLPPQLSPAEASAKVFEEAGSALPKNIAEDIVARQSKLGKTAEQAAEILAPKELPVTSNVKPVKDLVVQGERLPEKISKGLPSIVDDVIPTTGRVIGEEVPKISKVSKYIPALGLGVAGYQALKGDVVEGGVTGLETLLGAVAPRLAAPLELLRPTATASDDDMDMRKKVAEWNKKQEAEQRKIPSGPASENLDLSINRSEIAKDDENQLLKDILTFAPNKEYLKTLEKTQEETPSAQGKVSASAPITKKAAAITTEQPEKDPLMAAIKAESEQPKKQATDFMSLLEQAKKARDTQQLMAGLGQAGETLGSAIGGMVRGGVVTKPTGTDFYKNLAKEAEQRIEDVGTQYSMEQKQEERDRLARRRDPNSEESKFSRELLKQQGITVPESATAEALEKYAPQLTNIFNQREAQKSREMMARERAADRDTILQSKLEGKKLDTALRLAPKIQNKQYDTFSEMRSQSALMQESLKNPNPTRDVAIIYGFVKALDPKSAVREGEIDFVQLGRSVPTKINQYFKRAFSGEILPEAARKEMANYVAERENQARKEWTISAGPYLNQADKAGIDRELVAPGSTEMEQPTKSKKQVNLPSNRTFTPGSKVTTKTGVYIVDPSGKTATEE